MYNMHIYIEMHRVMLQHYLSLPLVSWDMCRRGNATLEDLLRELKVEHLRLRGNCRAHGRGG